MKFLHISDIHLGKRMFGCSLSADHAHILSQYLTLAADPTVSAILIAGDVYNRAQPQPDAIAQFSSFLTSLSQLSKPVFIIRGNHDGEAQLAYAAPLLAPSNIHINPIFSGSLHTITLSDQHGPLHIHLLPFIKPLQARKFYPDEKIETYADALTAVLSHADINPAERNILVTHQYVLGAQTSDSEERSIGGVDQIPSDVFQIFDYVALGHLHKSQTLSKGKIRYCGAPLVYSFDECNQQKTATLVTIGEKGAENIIETVPLEPLHPCRKLEGTLRDLAAQPRSEDYVQIHLTDEIRPLDPVGTLRLTYPNLLNLTFARAAAGEDVEQVKEFEPSLSPLEQFISFYTAQNKRPPSDAQIAIVQDILSKEADA